MSVCARERMRVRVRVHVHVHVCYQDSDESFSDIIPLQMQCIFV